MTAISPVGRQIEALDPPGDIELTVLVPVFDEEESVPGLYDEITAVLESVPGRAEIILVDDGSRDATLERLRALHAGPDRLHVIGPRSNSRKTPAPVAGLRQAPAEIVRTPERESQ